MPTSKILPELIDLFFVFKNFFISLKTKIFILSFTFLPDNVTFVLKFFLKLYLQDNKDLQANNDHLLTLDQILKNSI